jgi:serine/threonine protein kinase
LLLSRNISRALAELHTIGVVHGDIATENILVDSKSLEVKLIDFDLSSKVGNMILAGGNPDFVTADMAKAIVKRECKVETTFNTDLYALALCCYLILGD